MAPERRTVSQRLAGFVTRFPKAVLLLVAVATVLFAAWLPTLHIDQSADGILLENDPERAVVSELAATFGLDEILVVVVRSDTVFSRATLERIRRLGEAFERIDGVTDVLSLAHAQYISGSSDGLSVEPLVPVGSLDDEDLDRVRERALAGPLYVKHLVSADGRTAALNLFLEDRPSDRDYRAHVVDSARRILEREQGPEEVYLAGIPRTKVALAQQMLRDVLVLSPITLAVLTAVMWLCFGTVRGVALPAVTIGLALTWTMGAFALSGASISLVTNALIGMIQCLGTSYVIFLMGGYYESVAAGADGKQATYEMLEHVTAPVFVSAVTTAVGFLSLATSDVSTVKTLGLFGAFGVLAAMVLGLTFLPAVLSLLPAEPMDPPRWVADSLDRALLQPIRISTRHPVAIALGAAAVAAIAAVGISRVYIETDYTSYLPADSEVRVTSHRISRELSGSIPLYIAIEGETPDAVLEPAVLRKIADLQRFAEGIEGVDATLSLADYVQVIHREASDGPADGSLPQSLAEATQCLGLYSVFSPTNELWHYVSDDRRRANIMVRTHMIASSDLEDAIARLRARGQELFAGTPIRVTVTGSMALINKTANAISRGQVQSLVLSLAGVALILWIVFRSPWRVLAALPSNLLPVALPYGLMGFLGIPLSTGTCLVGSLVFGISVDDTVHYLMRYHRERAAGRDPEKAIEETTRSVGRPMLFTAISLALGFSVLLASGFLPLRAFGGLTAVTWIAAVCVDLFVLPALLLASDRWLRRGA